MFLSNGEEHRLQNNFPVPKYMWDRVIKFYFYLVGLFARGYGTHLRIFTVDVQVNTGYYVHDRLPGAIITHKRQEGGSIINEDS